MCRCWPCGVSARTSSRPTPSPPWPASIRASRPSPFRVKGTPLRSPDRRSSKPSNASSPGSSTPSRFCRARGPAGRRADVRPTPACAWRDKSAPLVEIGVRGRRVATLVVDFDLGAADGVAHGLGALLDVLVDDQLLLDPRLLVDHRLLGALLGLDRALAEQRVAARVHGTIEGAALDIDALLAQVHLLLDGRLDHMRVNANAP